MPQKSKTHLSVIFPAQINEFTFWRLFSDFKGTSNFKFALYRNSKNVIAICKLHTTNQNLLDRYWLENEIAVYQFFTNHNAEIIKLSKNTRFPRLFATGDHHGQMYVLVEFIQGKHLTDAANEVQVRTFDQIITDLENISKHTNLSGSGIVSRNFFQKVLFFHWYFLCALVKNSRLIPTLILNTADFYQGVHASCRVDQHIFTHRDLGHDNCILVGNKIYLIDFQVSAVATKYTEITNILTAKWGNTDLRKQLLSSSKVQAILRQKESRAVFKAFLFYNAIFKLARGKQKDIIECLDVIKNLPNL